VRFSQLAGKEIINLVDGERLGRLGEADVAIDETTGALAALIVPPRPRLWRPGLEARIPWEAVRRVGPDVLIVELPADDLPRRVGRN
jgi:YlmC/YmxH family sporulation protein